MKRRAFIAFVGGAIVAMPSAVLAQQPARIKRIGVLMGVADDAEGQTRLTAFVKELQLLGWIDGRNFMLDTHWAAGDADKTRLYAADLIALGPDIVLAATTAAFVAMQKATKPIPIVFVQVVEPLSSGLVDSLAHPTGNFTGFTSFEYATSGKWLAMVKEIVPGVVRVAVVHHPDDPASAGYLRESETSARTLGVQVVRLGARTIIELERSMEDFAREPNGGVISLPSAFTAAHHERIVALAALYRLPGVYPYRYYATAGGLISYGFDNIELYRRAASYVDRILKGATPHELPIQQPTKFELVVNLKTAKRLGLVIPESFLVRSDEVIE